MEVSGRTDLCQILKQANCKGNREGVILNIWGCVKSVFMALRAKLYLDEDIFSLILRSKIREKMSSSKEYGAV